MTVSTWAVLSTDSYITTAWSSSTARYLSKMPVTKSRACKRCFPCPRNRWPVGCGPVFQLPEPSNRTNEAGLSTNRRLESYWDQGFSSKTTLATVTHVLHQGYHVSPHIPTSDGRSLLHRVTRNLRSLTALTVTLSPGYRSSVGNVLSEAYSTAFRGKRILEEY